MQYAAALGLPMATPLILAKPVAGANEKLNLAWVGFGNPEAAKLINPEAREAWRSSDLA